MSLFTLPTTFYPTPPALIYKMLACVDFEQVEEILEPSAGDGAIVWAIAERFCGRYNRREKPVDCIELDENLRAILRYRFSKERRRAFTAKHSELDTFENRRDHNPESEEYSRMMDICSYPVRIIHDDFLTYQCVKRYQVIIMNPPFDNGDEHLHKALDIMQGGGQVVCLLNAETIRNPYTISRQILMRRLDNYEAKIQFLPGEFETQDAQRKTEVEVALVNVTIPPAKHPSFFFDRLQKAKEEAPEVLPPESLMRMGDKVVQMVELFQFEAACGISLIREYEALRPYLMSDLSPEAPFDTCILTLTVGTDGNCLQRCDVNEYLHKTRLKYWRSMMNAPWFSNLTSNLQEEYRNTVNKMAEYDFTEFNIRQVMVELQSKLSQGVDDTILAIFDKLTEHTLDNSQNIHYYNGWRTNKGSKIGKKAIIPTWGVFSTYSWNKGKLDASEAYNYLVDIEKVLNYLDDGSTGEVDLSCVLRAASNGGWSRGIACKYFTVDLYKKGTCHIKFSNQDVIDRLNIYGGRRRGWLPPNYGRTRYKDLSEEERVVVDDFQGEQDYEKVCADPGLWLMEPQRTLMIAASKDST